MLRRTSVVQPLRAIVILPSSCSRTRWNKAASSPTPRWSACCRRPRSIHRRFTRPCGIASLPEASACGPSCAWKPPRWSRAAFPSASRIWALRWRCCTPTRLSTTTCPRSTTTTCAAGVPPATKPTARRPPSLQRVAGKDGGGLAVGFVAGGTPAAQVVVVERGQVVVDERVGVQHLQRRAQLLDAERDAALDHLRGFHAQDGPQALASGKDAVSHRGVNRRRILGGLRQQALQRGVGEDAALFQRVLEHEEGSITTARCG